MFKKKQRPVVVRLVATNASLDWIGGDDEPPPGISTRMYTFRGLLRSAELFVVPPYQRAYAWGEDEVERLLNDFLKALEDKKDPYFLGTSVRQRTADGVYQVIDGQQRLMTLTLLIAFLRDMSQDKAIRDHLQELIAPRSRGRLVVRRADQELVSECVQKPGRLAKMAEAANSPSQRRLAEAASLIVETLSALSPEVRADIAHFICCNVTFNVVDAAPDVSAATLFNVLNQRGLRLPESALVKSQLLVSSSIPESEAGELSDRWDKLEDDLGQEPFEQLLRMTPLLITAGARKKEADLSLFYAAEFTAKQAAEFVRTRIWEYAEIFRLFNATEIEHSAANDNVKRLLKLLLIYTEKTWQAPTIDFLLRHPLTSPETEKFLFGVERLCFARAMGLIQHNAAGPRFVRALAARGDLGALFQPNVLGLKDKDEEKGKEAEAVDLIARLNTPVPTNVYRRRILALRANAALPGGEVPCGSDADATVEHLWPLNDTPFWQKQFPRAASREQRNLLGNFALLTQRQNDEAANLSWPEKRAVYFKTRRPIRALTRTLERVEEWNELQLRKRHEMLVDTLCEDLKLQEDLKLK